MSAPFVLRTSLRRAEGHSCAYALSFRSCVGNHHQCNFPAGMTCASGRVDVSFFFLSVLVGLWDFESLGRVLVVEVSGLVPAAPRLHYLRVIQRTRTLFVVPQVAGVQVLYQGLIIHCRNRLYLRQDNLAVISARTPVAYSACRLVGGR